MSVNVPDDQWNAAARDAGLEPVAGAPLTAEERAAILQRIDRGYVWAFQVRNDMARLLAALDAAEAERDAAWDEVERRAKENAALQDRQIEIGHVVLAVASRMSEAKAR